MDTFGQTGKEAIPGRGHGPRFATVTNTDKTFSKYHLSEREFAVLAFLSEGCSDKEVATALSVTTYTVNKHVGAILVKMNVRSRTAAAVHAIREHLFDDPPGILALKSTA